MVNLGTRLFFWFHIYILFLFDKNTGNIWDLGMGNEKIVQKDLIFLGKTFPIERHW